MDKLEVKGVPDIKGLLPDPREMDSFFDINTFKKEVRDSRTIESGDIILTTVKFEDEESSYTLEVATLKPKDSPVEYTPDYIPYPDSTDNVFIRSVALVQKSADLIFFNKRQSFFDKDFENPSQTPYKDVSDEAYYVGHGKIKPRFNSSLHHEIFNPKKDWSKFDLDKENTKKLYANTVEVRKYLAENLQGQPDVTTGLTDPRLHQLDNLINFLSTKIYFSK